MRFSKTTDYAVRIMVALALAGEGQRLSLQTLSRRERIPRKFLEHVIRSLREADLIRSSPGPKGGYQLAQPPEYISLAQILLAAQGPFLPMDRLDPDKVPPHLRDPVERLRLVIDGIRTFARQQLTSITLADLAQVREVDEAHKALMYYI